MIVSPSGLQTSLLRPVLARDQGSLPEPTVILPGSYTERWASQVAQCERSVCQCRRCQRHEFSPWVRKIPWRRAWQRTPVLYWRMPRTEEPGGHKGVHGVTKSWTRLSKWTHIHRTEKFINQVVVGWEPEQGMPAEPECAMWVVAERVLFQAETLEICPEFNLPFAGTPSSG